MKRAYYQVILWHFSLSFLLFLLCLGSYVLYAVCRNPDYRAAWSKLEGGVKMWLSILCPPFRTFYCSSATSPPVICHSTFLGPGPWVWPMCLNPLWSSCHSLTHWKVVTHSMPSTQNNISYYNISHCFLPSLYYRILEEFGKEGINPFYCVWTGVWTQGLYLEPLYQLFLLLH
jgi:hypothetical protein